jgi:hypothetical protein
MAVLTAGSGGHRRVPVRAGLLAVAAYALLIGGCMVFETLGSKEDTRPKFSHAQHMAQGLSCADCHAPARDGGPPGMPAAAQCEFCHHSMNLDAGKPPELQPAAFFVDGKPLDTGTGKFPAEVIFSHGYHTDLGLECGTCHQGIDTSTAVDPSLMQRMDDCQRCHADKGVNPACATCHKEIRTDARPPNHTGDWQRVHGAVVRGGAKDAASDCALCHTEASCNECHQTVPPASHTGAWQRVHGSVVRGGSQGTANDCALCHTEASCNECHQAVPPASHNNLWRLKTHGDVAGMNRQNCAVCHRTDFCERCHEDTPPLSHKGGWGSPLDKHCLSCHFPLKSNSCSVCHRGTPSHQLAAPLPANHNPGMNCVQCHGISAPLPHPDKGDSCIMCHK